MPVEIKELVIRAVVDYQEDEHHRNAKQQEATNPIDQKALIEACVRKVLSIINRSKQR